MANGINIRAFARLEQISGTLVHKAIRQGRLARRADGLLEPALIGTGWHARGGARGTATLPVRGRRCRCA